jgi:hypothetical protein
MATLLFLELRLEFAFRTPACNRPYAGDCKVERFTQALLRKLEGEVPETCTEEKIAPANGSFALLKLLFALCQLPLNTPPAQARLVWSAPIEPVLRRAPRS